jgi:methylisocitrate lyase
MTVGVPPSIQSYSEMCASVGFNKYWEREEKYKLEKFYKGETN